MPLYTTIQTGQSQTKTMIQSPTGLALLIMMAAVLGLLVYYGILVKVVRWYSSDNYNDDLADRFKE